MFNLPLNIFNKNMLIYNYKHIYIIFTHRDSCILITKLNVLKTSECLFKSLICNIRFNEFSIVCLKKSPRQLHHEYEMTNPSYSAV